MKTDPLFSQGAEREALYKSQAAKFVESYNLQSEKGRSGGGTISGFILQEEVEKIDTLNVGLLPTCWGKNEKITKSSRLFFFFPSNTLHSQPRILHHKHNNAMEQRCNTHTFITSGERGSYQRCEIQQIAFFFLFVFQRIVGRITGVSSNHPAISSVALLKLQSHPISKGTSAFVHDQENSNFD